MKFKDDVIAARFDDMHIRAQQLAIEMDEWMVKHYGKELTLTCTTSTAVEDRALLRRSDTHRTGRAFDLRITDLSDEAIADFCAYFRKRYPSLGAVNPEGSNLIVYKPHGSGPHFHIQLNRTYTKIIQEKK